jgi:predicted benzoate:H+ symporter BenE
LVAIGVAIFAVVVSMQYHSPQYFMWYAPIFCLLVADSVYGTLIFCTVSTMVYFEFPIFYGVLYQNGQFVTPGASWFFVAEWAMMVVMVWLAIRTRTFISEENKPL